MKKGRPIFELVIVAVLVLFCLSSCSPRDSVQPGQGRGKIALVLGGGAARGFAHIGVLKVLEMNKIPFDIIVGTSAGSFVASLSAYGFNAYQIQKISLEMERSEIVDISIPDNGFIKGDLLEEYINRMLRNTTMEKLRIPFYAVATDIQSGREVVFASGNTGRAVRASCAIPGIFNPVRIGDHVYVDGSVVSPVAVDAARAHGATLVIAVDISSDLDTSPPSGAIETILQAISIMGAKISADQLSRADVVIRPLVGHIGAADFTKRHEAVLEGEKAAIRALPKLKEIMARYRPEAR
jgi:NTE family protein